MDVETRQKFRGEELVQSVHPLWLPRKVQYHSSGQCTRNSIVGRPSSQYRTGIHAVCAPSFHQCTARAVEDKKLRRHFKQYPQRMPSFDISTTGTWSQVTDSAQDDTATPCSTIVQHISNSERITRRVALASCQCGDGVWGWLTVFMPCPLSGLHLHRYHLACLRHSISRATLRVSDTHTSWETNIPANDGLHCELHGGDSESHASPS